MVDEDKLKRLLELKKLRDDAEKEINDILGGEKPKRKWTRRANGGEGTVEGANPPAAN